jgi:GH18 family chitinase
MTNPYEYAPWAQKIFSVFTQTQSIKKTEYIHSIMSFGGWTMTPNEDGYLPGYTGFVRHKREVFGQTYAKATVSSKSYDHPEPTVSSHQADFHAFGNAQHLASSTHFPPGT